MYLGTLHPMMRYVPPFPVPPFHEGQVADAEPAVPGWRMVVHDLFAPNEQGPGQACLDRRRAA